MFFIPDHHDIKHKNGEYFPIQQFDHTNDELGKENIDCHKEHSLEYKAITGSLQKRRDNYMRSMTFDDTNYGFATHHSINTKTSSVYSAASSVSSDGSSPGNRIHVNIVDPVDDIDKQNTHKATGDGSYVCMECKHCINGYNMNRAYCMNDELNLLKPNESVLFNHFFVFSLSQFYLDLQNRLSSTITTSTNSSLNESNMDTSDISKQFSANNKYGSMENLGSFSCCFFYK